MHSLPPLLALRSTPGAWPTGQPHRDRFNRTPFWAVWNGRLAIPGVLPAWRGRQDPTVDEPSSLEQEKLPSGPPARDFEFVDVDAGRQRMAQAVLPVPRDRVAPHRQGRVEKRPDL